MLTLSAKTVNDIYLFAIKSMLAWAVENDRLRENVVALVKQRKPCKVYCRECGYTESEAVKVLKASRSYEPAVDEFGMVRETDRMVDLKRWVPLICAFAGAHVSETIQLRKEDVTKIGDHWVARITPDAAGP